MANYTTSADLLADILFRANETTDGTSDFDTVALKYLNRAYQSLWSGGSELDPEIDKVWWWLRKDDQGVITLDPLYDTGTVSVTNNNATITFSAPIADSMAGRHFKVDDHADVFIITAHTAASDTATLESVYTGDTDATANYRNMKIDYDLASDVLYITSPFIAYQDSRKMIPIIDLSALKTKWPTNQMGSGVPKNAAMIGQKKVRFSHYGGNSSADLIKLDYEYIYEPSDLVDDSAEPLVPRQYRKLLADWALMYVLADQDDSKAGDIGTLARNGLRAMAKEHERHQQKASGSETFGRIFPRQTEIDHFRGPLRTESGLIIGY